MEKTLPKNYLPTDLHDWWRNLSESDTVLVIENQHRRLTKNITAEITIGKVMRGPYDHVTHTTGNFPQALQMTYNNTPYFCGFYPKWDELDGRLYHLPMALSHDKYGDEIEDRNGNPKPRLSLAPVDLDVAAYSERVNLAQTMHKKMIHEADTAHRIILEMPIEEIRNLFDAALNG